MGEASAEAVVAALRSESSTAELEKLRHRLGSDEAAFGVRMKMLFDTAKAYTELPLAEVHRLLDQPAYEPRLAAFCVLDFKARRRLSDEERRELYEVYLDRHDRITSWDMVDRAAPRVVGGYLTGRSLRPLHELARSADPLRRRTAITAPLYFARYGSADDIAEAFAIAGRLADDPDPVVHNAVGIYCKHAGTRDESALIGFLDEHAASMARAAVRLAAEKLPSGVRGRYVRSRTG